MAKIKKLDDREVIDLAKAAASGASTQFSSNEEMRDALTAIVYEKMKGSIPNFHQHKYEFYNLVQQAVDEILPKKVLQNVGMFANVKFFKDGERPIFTRKLGRNRAKQFITSVAPSGAYETFNLDSEEYTLNMKATGGQARVDFERFLAGYDDITEMFQIIVEGIEECIYRDIQQLMSGVTKNMPTANKVISNTFEADKMRSVLNTVRAYGDSAVIFCPPEFASAMDIPAYGSAGSNPSADIRDIAQVRDTGYLGTFYGAPIILIPQSFVDETNTIKVINTRQAYVFPTGKEKAVDLAIEGILRVDDFKNRDGSVEIQAYKKTGLAIHHYHNWGTYINNGIPQEAEGFPVEPVTP